MSQSQQYKKVKLYRNLKIAFYMLGLPLFLLAVFFTSVRFLGHDPFMGTTEITTELGFFKQVESYITAPALYGVWIGFGVWAFITIVHIILSKTVKNARVRMFSVIAVCMVAMLGTGLVLDVVYEAKVADLQEQYEGTGVTIDDYKTQLSYYRHLSSNASSKDMTTKLIEQISLLEDVYNVEMEGANKSGTAGNIANKPITYYSIIDDNGNQGVDISYRVNSKGLKELNIDTVYDGKGNVIGHNVVGDDNLAAILDHTYRVPKTSIYYSESSVYDYKKSPEYTTEIRLAPDVNGQLTIGETTYTNYWYQAKSSKTEGTIYVWYAKELMPLGTTYNEGGGSKTNITDGIYGKGVYNSNGLMGDGWAYSLENVLEILESYYKNKAIIDNVSEDQLNLIETKALQQKNKYYKTAAEKQEEGGRYASAWEQTLYANETEFTERFSLTGNGLDFLLAKVGGLLGDNSLFDFLLKMSEDGATGLDEVYNGFGGVGTILAPILKNLANGMSFRNDFGVDEATMATVAEWIGSLTGCTESQWKAIKDMYLVVTYNSNGVDGLYVGLFRDNGSGGMGTDKNHIEDGGDVLVDLWLSDTQLGVDKNGNVDYAFDLDHLNTFLNAALNGLMDKLNVDIEGLITGKGEGTMATIGGIIGPNGLINLVKTMSVSGKTYYGLEISGMSIPLINSKYKFDIDVKEILLDLLDGMYYYQSPSIMPIWEFYTWAYEGDESMADTLAIATAYRDYKRAEYQAVTFGSMIGSTLIGDELGAGTYPSSLGLSDLTSVQQLKADLSYKPYFYPVYGVRDMLFFFTGVVVLFYYLSFVAQQKEEEYANGTAVVKKKKNSKKSNKPSKAVQNDQAEDAPVLNDGAEAAPKSEEGTKTPDNQNKQGGAAK